jgi:hypothetical protein
MLPLLSTSLLDTLKILMIGNVLTYSNHMPVTFQNLFISEGRRISIDSIFMPDGGPECLLLKYIDIEAEECSSAYVKSHTFWLKENNLYPDFAGLVKGYDIIYLQPQTLIDPRLYEIIESIDQIIDKDAVIIVFQNYSTITSNENDRRKELDQQLHYFQHHNKSEKVTLMEIGSLFDKLTLDDPTGLFDSSGNPTKDGSDIIASTLYEIVRPYIY